VGVEGADPACRLESRQAQVQLRPERFAGVKPAGIELGRYENLRRRKAAAAGVRFEQEWGESPAQEACTLPGHLVDPGIPHDFRQAHEGRHSAAQRPSVGQKGAKVGMVVDLRPDGLRSGRVIGLGVGDAGQHRVAGRGMDRIGMSYRSNDGVLVGVAGKAREQLADPSTGHAGRDRPQLSPISHRRIGLGVEGVVLRRTTEGEEEDTGPRPAEARRLVRPSRRRRGGPDQSGQVQAQAGDRADPEKVPARRAIAEMSYATLDRPHPSLPIVPSYEVVHPPNPAFYSSQAVTR
jgi:hypothetical protein